VVNAAGIMGIDVSKKELAYALGDACSKRVVWERKVPNTPAGVRRILEQSPPGTAWVVEPTGRYSISLVKQARQADQRVFLAPPRKAKMFLASLPQRAKTDRLDSRGLAMFGLARMTLDPLAPYPIKSGNVERLDQLLSARKGLSRALSKLKQQRSELPHAAEALKAAVADLGAHIKALDKQIAALTEEDPDFAVAKELMKVPGIGKVTAAAVAARLSCKRFSHPDQFVAYVGLDLVVCDSGQRKGRHRISKQGDAELRRLLFLCAQASTRASNSPFKAHYERELHKGLTTTGALCAVARKLAKVCWSLHRHQSRYDPARVYQPPTPRTRAEDGAEDQTPEAAGPADSS